MSGNKRAAEHAPLSSAENEQPPVKKSSEDDAVFGLAVKHLTAMPYSLEKIEKLKNDFEEFVRSKGKASYLEVLTQNAVEAEGMVQSYAVEFLKFYRVKQAGEQKGRQSAAAADRTPEENMALAQLFTLVNDLKNAGEVAWGAASTAVKSYAARVYAELGPNSPQFPYYNHKRLNNLCYALFCGKEMPSGSGTSTILMMFGWRAANECHAKFNRSDSKVSDKDMRANIDKVGQFVTAVQAMGVDENDKVHLTSYMICPDPEEY